MAPPAPGSRLSSRATAGVNVSGAREAANNFLLDGIDNNDLFLNRLVVTPSLDAIQEFTLVQNTYDAEYGRNAARQVNVVLKSGAAARRVALRVFPALGARRARRLRSRPTSPSRGCGGTSSAARSAARSARHRAASTSSSVEGIGRARPTPALATCPRRGTGGRLQRLGVVLRDPFTGRPFPGNVFPADRLDPAGLAWRRSIPDPNRARAGPTSCRRRVGTRDGLQLTVKTDHHGWHDTPLIVPLQPTAATIASQPFPARGRNLPGFGVSVLDEGHNSAAGLTQVLSHARSSTSCASGGTRCGATTRRSARAPTGSPRSASPARAAARSTAAT